MSQEDLFQKIADTLSEYGLIFCHFELKMKPWCYLKTAKPYACKFYTALNKICGLSQKWNWLYHMKIKKPSVHFVVKIFLIENECKAPYVSCFHFLSKIFFYDKMDLRLFYFHLTVYDFEDNLHFRTVPWHICCDIIMTLKLLPLLAII